MAAPHSRHRSRGLSRRTLVVVLAIAVVAIAAVALLRPRVQNTAPTAGDKAPAVMELAAVDVGEVVRGPMQIDIPLSGSLRPYAQTFLKTKVAGEVRELPVREGEAVRKGQLVATIEDVELRARVAEKEAALEAARAQLDLARKNWAMNEALLEQKFISRNAADTVASSVEVGQANVRAAQAQLEIARKSAADARIVSPMNGVVAERFCEPGERLPVDGKVVSIVDPSRLELEADIPASSIGAVQVGAPVRFWIEGLGDRAFEGRVDRINPQADERSRTVKVYVVIGNSGGELRGGMFAKGHLVAGTRADVTLVPLAALREEGDSTVVFEDTGGVVTRRVVRVGAQDPARGVAEILEGLAPGARVLNANLTNLRPGDRVRLVPASGG